jgi:hypothetical protein
MINWSSQVVAELSLASSPAEFGRRLEQLATRLTGAGQPTFLAYQQHCDQLISHDGSALAIAEDSLAGRCALYQENLATPDQGLALLVRSGGSLGGVLLLASPADGDLLEELVELAGSLYSGAVRREEEARYQSASLDLMIRAAELLPQVGAGHVGRVARLVYELAVQLDLASQDRQRLWQAAHYHDVGWLTLPDSERAALHPQAGAAFLEACPGLRSLAPLVESHHERYDGSGFPHGRRADQLPLEAWLLALAEHAAERRHALGELLEGRGLHHPEALHVLGGLHKSGRLEMLLR